MKKFLLLVVIFAISFLFGSLPVFGQTYTSTDIVQYLPFVAAGGSTNFWSVLKSQIEFSGLSRPASGIHVRLSFKGGPNGQNLILDTSKGITSYMEFEIPDCSPRFATETIVINPTPDLRTGWAEIHSNYPVGVSLILSQFYNGQKVGQTTVLSSSPLTSFSMKFDNNTGLAIANPGNSVATVRITDGSNDPRYNHIFTIQPGGYFGRYLYQDPFNFPQNAAGVAVITSDVPIIATMLELDDTGMMFSVVPVFPPPSSGGDGALSSGVTWLSFTQGDPGTPGDGRIISSSNGIFDFATPFGFQGITDGISITVFPGGSSVSEAKFSITALVRAKDSDILFTTSEFNPASNKVVKNGVSGFLVKISQDDLEKRILNAINTVNFRNYTLDDLEITGLWINWPYSFSYSIDAATIGCGQNTLP